MSLPDPVFIVLAAWFGLSCLATAAWALVASCRRSAPPPPPDPDETADDFDDVARLPFTDAEGTRWLPTLPPCPPPTRLPESSPLDLTGYALDAKFYAIVAPSFSEYR